jgi:hypothetical protein
VDEKAYRELDTLPKQNLDMAPDLLKLWGRPEPTGLMPNTGAAPKTMLDLAPKGQRDPYPEGIVRTARLLVMQAKDSSELVDGLLKRFPKEALRQAKDHLASVLAERGLLGPYYVAASDFPTCQTRPDLIQAFAGRYAKSARYLEAKQACEGCQHASKTQCAVFQKQLVPVVPYTDADAAMAEQFQQARGLVASSQAQTPRERIQRAFMASAPAPEGFTGNPNQGALIPASRLLKKAQDPQQAEQEAQQVLAAKGAPVLATVRRELLKGRGQSDVAQALKLSFDASLLVDTKDVWGPAYHQAGLYGTVYTTQDSFTDCREGSEFLARHASRVRVVVAGSKCSGCSFAKAGACQAYGRRLVASVEQALTPDAVQWVLEGHKMAGKLPWDAHQRSWGPTPEQALKQIHKAATALAPYVQAAPQRALVERGRTQFKQASETSDLTVREVVKAASQIMNEGLFGSELQRALLHRFDPRDLQASSEALREVVAEQGLQGVYYVDPTPYPDYGIGCREAARLHRSRTIKLAKAGPRCAGCVGQQIPGQCSVLAKQLVSEVVYEPSKQEVQRAVLASSSMSVEPADLINNGADMLAEFQMQQVPQDLEVDDPSAPQEFGLEFGQQDVTF